MSKTSPPQPAVSLGDAAAQQKGLAEFCYNAELVHYSVVDPRVGHHRAGMEWEAVLYVRARDAGRLLREGLCAPATDFVVPYPCSDDLTWRGWPHAQQYALRGGWWTARLVVGAREPEVLARFRMDHVEGKMASACVWDREGLPIFHHDVFDAAQQQQQQQNNYEFPCWPVIQPPPYSS
ncbi:hypothetical protein LY76DRAFT_516809 [Colletotrichum caudatum]|nr:hypothetical protein LY76DRAFT_516809 [Colletotrichum caudatum]